MAAGDGSDYRVIETLGETRGEKLYRACDRAGRPVVLKVLGNEGPESRRMERLENELRIAARVGTPAVVRPIALDRFHGYPALVLEDVAGSTLDRMADGPIELGRFLRLAVAAATALEDVHRHGVIHKDLKPPNMLVDPQTGQVRLFGFGSASLMPRELQVPRHPAQLEGTLAYMSPEQTGRLHRVLDSRTDLYSLGVTFYEMLTGRLPFSAADPLGWVQCHLARAPVPPVELRPTLPLPVSLIVMKLLAKPAEDRYQSAAGLRYDLERCQRHFADGGQIPAFALATRDVWDRLQIPEKIYGRQTERAALRAAFERVVRERRPQVVLLSGAGGIGKSTLGHELEAAVVRERGVFLSGKFAPDRREAPYATVIEALRDLLADVLTESDVAIASWRRRLGDALGTNAQLMIDLLPALELLLGKQPPVVELPAIEAQLRFAVTLQKLLAALPHPDQPVVLFLDDLQWADAASLELLQRAALYPGMGPLLLVGTVRSDDPASSGAGPLLPELRGSAVPVAELVLGPLGPGALADLIADTLHCSADEAVPLAALVQEKTGGNPFFATQFLMELWKEGLLVLDRGSHGWQWELAEIAARGFSSDVVAFMAAKVRRLPADTQATLRLAACLGRPFDIRTLAALANRPEAELEAALLPAVSEALVLYTDGRHRFAHDRVREAAYQLVDEGDRPQIHLRIGRWLLAGRPPGALGDELFDAAGQLNRGRALITRLDDRLQLAEVNLVAARRAMDAHGPAAAVAYLGAGLEALGDDPWAARPALARELLVARASCASLCGMPEAVLRDCDQLIAYARTPLEQAAPYRLKQEAHLARGELFESAQAAIERLAVFGIHLPYRPTWEDALAERERVRRLMRDRPLETLVELPAMRDPALEAALDAAPPVASFDLNLYCVFVGRMVALTLEHGLADASAQWFATYAFAVASAFDEPVEARRLCRLALQLTERRGTQAHRPRVLLSAALVQFWTDPIEDQGALAAAALEAGQRIGSVREVSLAVPLVVRGLLAAGEPLERVAREAERRLPLARSPDARDSVLLVRQFARALQGQTAGPTSFEAPDLDEAAVRAANGPGLRRGEYWVWKLRAAFLARDWAVALEAADRAQALSRELAGHMAARDYHLFRALTLAALYLQQPAELQEAWLIQIREHERRLRRWCAINPRTFRASLELVAAELARLCGRFDEAARLYDHGVRWAEEGRRPPEEALGHELAAAFWSGRGQEETAATHLRLARDAHARWGATLKVRELEETPALRGAAPAHAPGGTGVPEPEAPETPRERQLARRLEQERAARLAAEEARQKVEQAVRARDELLHIASHELNTPLAALLLNLDALKSLQPPHQNDTQLVAGMAAVAHRQGLRLSRLVRDLLDATRIDRGALRLSPVKVELGGLVREVLITYASELAQAGCDVTIHQSVPVVGWWDIERLHQLVLNLLSNAAKFGHDRPIEIRVDATGELARLSVSDHGIGIPREGRDRLFERYERGDTGAEYGGLGLGLHICSHIVQAHGGSISVDSEPGQGATFTVELPYLAR